MTEPTEKMIEAAHAVRASEERLQGLIANISDAISVIEDFLDQARRAGVTVVGGLPTLPAENTSLREAMLNNTRYINRLRPE